MARWLRRRTAQLGSCGSNARGRVPSMTRMSTLPAVMKPATKVTTTN